MTTKVPVELSSTPGIVDGSNATAITIDSSENVGIGITSSLEKFTVSNSSSGIVGRFTNNTNQTLDLGVISGSGSAGGVYYNNANSGYHAFQVGGTEKIRLSSGGEFGIGNTAPDALGSGYSGVQIGGYAYNIGHSGGDHYITNNAYHNSGWKYGQTSTAQKIQLASGMVTISTAASGSADAAITFTEVLRVDSQGVHASLPAQSGVGKFGGTSANAVSLADDGLLDISQGGTCGAWIVHVYERGSGAGAYYWCNYDGTTKLVDQEPAGGNGFEDSDADGYYCLYKGDDSHTVYFKNRNGSTRSFMITIFGGEV